MEYAFLNKKENWHALVYASLAFILPFLFNHPQWIVGTAVNMLLVLGAYSLPWKKIWPIIILPSMGAMASGIVFGPMSYLLLYMIPFIWAGNALFVLMLKKLNGKAILAPVGKAGMIFAGSAVLFYLGLVPAAFLVAMGPMQLLTAFGGLGAAHLVRRII